jgi:hypothetical protein
MNEEVALLLGVLFLIVNVSFVFFVELFWSSYLFRGNHILFFDARVPPVRLGKIGISAELEKETKICFLLKTQRSTPEEKKG